MKVFGGGTAGGVDDQFAALIVDEHDGTDRRIESFSYHFRDGLENAVQIAFRCDRLGDGGESFHAAECALRLFGEAGFGQRSTHLFADERDQRHFVGGVLMRFAMMDVDDADQVAAAHQRNREEGLVSIFLEGREALEAGIERGVLAKRDNGFVLGNPAGDTFAHLQADVADFTRVRQLRRAQDDLVGGVVDKVDKTGVGVGDLHNEAHEFPKHGLEFETGADNAADAVQ